VQFLVEEALDAALDLYDAAALANAEENAKQKAAVDKSQARLKKQQAKAG
jgi:hypothetical protein